MKRTKRLLSLILIFALLFTTFETVRFSAATDDTKYSKKHLQNGSFEENNENYSFNSTQFYAQPPKGIVPYWDTTAYGGKFEFFKSKSPHFKVTQSKYPNNPDYRNVAKGDVAAELNADEESTIYQRIETIVGSTYTWGLSHRGRDTTDSMVLFIGPEQYDASGKAVDPSKPSKDGQDQFVRITDWLKKQYGVNYPKTGCSHKYTVYSKAFAERGGFVNEDKNDDNNNISLIKTNEINQEWSVWVISSPYCETDPEKSVKGWTTYGTNRTDDFDDIIKGASSSLGYDCTYTVPKGQTKTIFAFCSYSSQKSSNGTPTGELKHDPTYGNLLDNINFDLYQPVSSSITPGGIAGAVTIKVTSDIITGNAMHSVIRDEGLCTLYTTQHEESLSGCAFSGAYVTINNPDGTSVTTFRKIYAGEYGDFDTLSDEKREEVEKEYFIHKPNTVADNKKWDYYTKITVETPVSVHLIYTKAPFVLYDSNGGKEYYFSPNNGEGGNLVGFGSYFQADNDTDYYKNSHVDEETGAVTQKGIYISHAALPNENWAPGSSKFCGWSILESILDSNGNQISRQIILEGNHTVTYDPTTGGIVSFSDGKNVINDLQLDATHGVTLTAIWQFVSKAQAQTYNNKTKEYENSAEGGYVQETLIDENFRSEYVKEHTQTINGVDKIVSVDVTGDAGDKIMFKATPDYSNKYVFEGWYCKVKNNDGTYSEELRSTSTSIAVTIEEGKLNTYYARFKKATYPVVFKYSSSGRGNESDYEFYDKTPDYNEGKYYQDVTINEYAKKPTGDSKSVKIWFTSPTERGTEYIFDFENTPITKQTVLYAGPSFSYNYFNYFKLKEPWYINTYGTVKVNGKYIDLKNDPNVSDYNVYMLKGNLGESAPTPSYIKSNSKIKVGKSVNSEKLIYNTNTLTNTSGEFNRAGTTFSDFYLFNMKTPVWVVFDFTYKGVKYTSTVKDRCLYNNITTYLREASNGYYTDYPPETQAELRAAQKTLLDSIQAMYDAVEPSGITEPSTYSPAVSVSGLTYDSTTDGTYKFSSTTAIRNIEPWGLKYTFTVDNQTVTDFDDYGAIIMTDTAEAFKDKPVTADDLLNNENSVMYSKSNKNIYDGGNGVTEVYYVNNMLALDFDKNTYAVFFVKDSEGKTYYSNVVSNSYNSIVKSIDENNTSNEAKISKSIMNYSNALINYTNLVKKAEIEKG